MFEQDYIMRVIKELIRAVLKLFFNLDTEAPTAELLEEKEDREALEKLLRMIDKGSINQAENELYEMLSRKNISDLKIALLFYSSLNDKDDEFLERHDFSREEIQTGLRTVVSQYGLNIAEMFYDDTSD